MSKPKFIGYPGLTPECIAISKINFKDTGQFYVIPARWEGHIRMSSNKEPDFTAIRILAWLVSLYTPLHSPVLSAKDESMGFRKFAGTTYYTSQPMLAQMFHVSISTSKRAIATLKDLGLIVTQQLVSKTDEGVYSHSKWTLVPVAERIQFITYNDAELTPSSPMSYPLAHEEDQENQELIRELPPSSPVSYPLAHPRATPQLTGELANTTTPSTSTSTSTVEPPEGSQGNRKDGGLGVGHLDPKDAIPGSVTTPCKSVEDHVPATQEATSPDTPAPTKGRKKGAPSMAVTKAYTAIDQHVKNMKLTVDEAMRMESYVKLNFDAYPYRDGSEADVCPAIYRTVHTITEMDKLPSLENGEMLAQAPRLNPREAARWLLLRTEAYADIWQGIEFTPALCKELYMKSTASWFGVWALNKKSPHPGWWGNKLSWQKERDSKTRNLSSAKTEVRSVAIPKYIPFESVGEFARAYHADNVAEAETGCWFGTAYGIEYARLRFAVENYEWGASWEKAWGVSEAYSTGMHKLFTILNRLSPDAQYSDRGYGPICEFYSQLVDSYVEHLIQHARRDGDYVRPGGQMFNEWLIGICSADGFASIRCTAHDVRKEWDLV